MPSSDPHLDTRAELVAKESFVSGGICTAKLFLKLLINATLARVRSSRCRRAAPERLSSITT
jgi:hypothetical protein